MMQDYFVAHEGNDTAMGMGEMVATTGGGWWILTKEQMPGNDAEKDAKLIAKALNTIVGKCFFCKYQNIVTNPICNTCQKSNKWEAKGV